MNVHVLGVVAALVWGGVFALQLAAMWIQADIEKRWNEEWALEWERKHGRPIDELIEQIASQIRGWRVARRLLNVYLVLALAVMAVFAFIQWRGWVMGGPEFASLMRFLLGITGLLFVPLWAASWIGAGLVEAMYRQVRAATGERLEITSAGEYDRIPKPAKPPKPPKEAKAAPPPAKS